MAKDKKKMTEDELLSLIGEEDKHSLGVDSGKLSQQRADSMDYYLGRPYGTERPHKSHVVTREVMETVEWAMPYIMKLFFAGDDTVRFEPVGVEDVQAAQQETDYLNYIYERQNPGFLITYQVLKDGLLQKNGFVKRFWDGEETKTREDYENLTQEELMLLQADPDVEIIEEEEVEYEGEQVLTNVAIQRTCKTGKLVIEPVPPEEISVSSDTRLNIQEASYVSHKTRKSISDLRRMGFDEAKLDEIGADNDFGNSEVERNARFSADDTNPDYRDRMGANKVLVNEAYIRVDYNGDGIDELRKVVVAGNVVLDNEEVDDIPFAAWTPIIMSHKFFGMSLADLVMDLQLIKSTLMRNLLDNQYLTNNGRYAVLDNMVNLDDLATSRPHGFVREKVSGAVRELATPQLGATAFQMLDYIDHLRDRRTGISERSSGIDARALQPNTAATSFNQLMTAAEQRMELIARVFAETFVKTLFVDMHKLVLKNDSRQQTFKLRNNFITVNPSEWKNRTDMSVVVGLGTGNKDQQLLYIQQIMQAQQMIGNAGGEFQGMIAPQNVYNLAEDLVKITDKAAMGRYFTDPQTIPPKQGPSPQEMAMQQEMQLKERDMAVKEKEVQLKELDAQIKIAQIELEKAELALKKQIHEADNEFRLAEINLEATQQRAVKIGDKE